MAAGIEIRRLREKAGLSAARIADLLDVGVERLRKWESRNANPKNLDLVKVEKYFGCPISELENLEKFDFVEKIVPENLSTEYQLSKNFLNTRRENKNKIAPYMIPVVPVKAQAGYVHSYDSTDFIQQLDKFPIPPFMNPRGYEWRWFEVDGDSMEPNFYSGDFLLCTLVPFDQWKRLDRDYPHIIVTSKNVVLKRIVTHNKDEWYLESDNKHYADEPVKIKDVQELWKFQRNINSRDRAPKQMASE